MSNEDNSIIRFGDDTITALNFIPATNYVLAPVWEGSADDLAALVRDAWRFRRLAAHYCGSGRPEHGAIQLERWDAEWMDWVPLSDQPLAEIADALPEVEQK